jgi:hypothetical protein
MKEGGRTPIFRSRGDSNPLHFPDNPHAGSYNPQATIFSGMVTRDLGVERFSGSRDYPKKWPDPLHPLPGLQENSCDVRTAGYG